MNRKGTKQPRSRLLSLACLLAFSAQTQALSLSGQIVDLQDRPVAGALVILSGPGLPASSVTLYSDETGQFSSVDLGQFDLTAVDTRIRKPGYELMSTDLILSPEAGPTLEITARGTGNHAEGAPPSAWLAAIPDSTGKRVTVKLCVACHQFPSPKIRGISSTMAQTPVEHRQAFWGGTMRYMAYIFASYFTPTDQLDRMMPEYPAASMFAADDEAIIAPFVAQNLPTDFTHLDNYDYGAPLATSGAAVYEYDMPWQPKGLIHDVAVAKGPGGLTYGWGAEAHHNKLVRIDPRSGEQRAIEPPLPHSGIHTLVPDSAGNIWVTLQFVNAIARFNPTTEAWTLFEGFSDFSAIHSLSLNARGEIGFDNQGRLWTNLIGLNRIASLDPVTGKIEEFPLPQNEGDSAFYTQSYGLALRSDRRHLWITQLGTNRLVEFDTEAGKLTRVVQLERGSGPRRVAIDNRDVIWTPLYGSGPLLEFDAVAGRELARYDLPDRAAAPYTLSWDHRRNRIWVSGGNSDSVYRFDVPQKQFTVYPLPGSETVMRALPVDPDTGEVWSSYATQENVEGASRIFRLVPGSTPSAPINLQTRSSLPSD
ncbi:MAG: SMP-30/gluconolactonase/LRE family protein [Gammaproteobacteria bacterium]|nr:SMP-30/gluconolactonase/LRE family protein [Gammaproteobacteria bacterium]